MPIYNKIVHDGIPAIIESNWRKLKEFHQATNEDAIEELADLLELIYSVLHFTIQVRNLEKVKLDNHENEVV